MLNRTKKKNELQILESRASHHQGRTKPYTLNA